MKKEHYVQLCRLNKILVFAIKLNNLFEFLLKIKIMIVQFPNIFKNTRSIKA